MGEKDLKGIFRQEVLQWTPAQSSRFISAQGMAYFLGPQLVRPLLNRVGAWNATLLGNLCASVEHCCRAVVPGPGGIANALNYGGLIPSMPGNLAARISAVAAAQTAHGVAAGIPRGELA